jgi:hypothetical protein
MKTPTAFQVEQGARMLAKLADIGNGRPGDCWLSTESQREQFRIRSLDMLTVIMNAPDILGQVEAPAPAERGRLVAIAIGVVVLVGLAGFVCGVSMGMGI